ncbi:YciI family protein [Streptomyces sp. NPDC050400]|uniref:YciI family protein n=1 Tax=Streptomyces sp. NPDC050400 TaxID=3365610 RepID=UPI0037AB3345
MRYVFLLCAPDGGAELAPGTLAGVRLRPADCATTVRTRGSEVLVSDGPFTAGQEHVAGFDLVEAADLDEALDLAARHPVAAVGAVEVRPVLEPDE